MAKQHKWKTRKQLIAHLRNADHKIRYMRRTGWDSLAEKLADLGRSQSCLAMEAKAALNDTSNEQYERLYQDIKR